MKVVSAVMKKGGAGKTSTIVPLAYLAAQAGARVALIDMDTEPSAQQWVQAAGLAGERLACDRVTAEELDPLMQQIRASGKIDYVFIDTPPGDKFLIQQAMDASDLILIPAHNGSGDVAQLVATYHLMRMPLKANPNLKHLIVINHTGNTPAVLRETLEAITTSLPNAQVARTTIPYLKQYMKAKGSTPHAAKWWHYAKLLDEVKAALA